MQEDGHPGNHGQPVPGHVGEAWYTDEEDVMTQRTFSGENLIAIICFSNIIITILQISLK